MRWLVRLGLLMGNVLSADSGKAGAGGQRVSPDCEVGLAGYREMSKCKQFTAQRVACGVEQERRRQFGNHGGRQREGAVSSQVGACGDGFGNGN